MNKRQAMKLRQAARLIQAFAIVGEAIMLGFDVARGKTPIGRAYVVYPNDPHIDGCVIGRGK